MQFIEASSTNQQGYKLLSSTKKDRFSKKTWKVSKYSPIQINRYGLRVEDLESHLAQEDKHLESSNMGFIKKNDFKKK